MTAIELEASKLELIKDIIAIDSAKAIEKIRASIKRIIPKYTVEEDDTFMVKEDFYEMIKEAEESIRRGEGTRCNNKEELRALLDSL